MRWTKLSLQIDLLTSLCLTMAYNIRDLSRIRSFQDLTIGDMPRAGSHGGRAQGRAQGRGRGRGRERGRGRGQTDPPSHMPATPNEPFPGPSELPYTEQEPPPQSEARAAADVSFNFIVDRVQKHESGRGAYFAFQLKRPVSVRIYSPSGMGGQVECSCEEYQRTRNVCVHIYVNLPLHFPLPPSPFHPLHSLSYFPCSGFMTVFVLFFKGLDARRFVLKAETT